MTQINEYSIILLKTMYDDCIDNLNKKSNSLILSSLDSTKNTIRNALNASKIEGDDQLYADLLSEEYIRCIEPGAYALTAKGAWYVETEFYSFDISRILEYLDSSKFMLDSAKLGDKNKILLFALLSARCFTEDTCAEYTSEETENILLQLLKNSSEFLTKCGQVKSGNFDPTSKFSSKSLLGSFTGSIDKLPSKTYLLFKARNNRYYLDVAQDGKINKEKVTSLFKIVFDNKININDTDSIVDFCNDQCLNLGYVYHLDCTTSFSDSRVDRIIEECIMSAAGL